MTLPAPVVALALPAVRAGWLGACLVLALLAGLMHGSTASASSNAHAGAVHASTIGAGTPSPVAPSPALHAIASGEAETITSDGPRTGVHADRPLPSRAARHIALSTPDALHFRSPPLRMPPGHAPPSLQA